MQSGNDCGAVTKGKVQKSCTVRKTGECFQRKTIGSCSKRDICSFLHTHATGDRETMREEVGDAEKSRLEQASSSVPNVKEQTDVKSSNSPEASPATRAEIPCLWEARCKRSTCNYRHHPVCHGYKSGNRCIYGHCCLRRHADGERKPSARSKISYSRISYCSEKEKDVQGCASQNSDPMNSILRKVEELGLNASAGHTMKFLGCIWYETKIRERKWHLEALSKKVKIMSEMRKPHDLKFLPAKQRGILREKFSSSKPKIKLRFILL